MAIKNKITGKNTRKRGTNPEFQSRIFKPGQSGNPAGRPFGARSYATIYREALIKLAKSKGVTPEVLEETILQVGIAKAIGGDYRFYQDILDRGDGKPIQRNEITGANGKDFIPEDSIKDLINDFITGGKN